VPAHIGRAAYHLARGDWGEAARTAEAGLAIADRTGYVVWAIHHVLPIIGEAAIHARNLPRAKEVGARMRAEAETVGHPLGLAWAEACEAVLTWLEGDARNRGDVRRRVALGKIALAGGCSIVAAVRCRTNTAPLQMVYIPPPYPTEPLLAYLHRLEADLSRKIHRSAAVRRFDQHRRPFVELMERLGVEPGVLIGVE